MLFAPLGNLLPQRPKVGDSRPHLIPSGPADRNESGDRLVVPGDDDLLSPRYAIKELTETGPCL